MVTFLTDEYEYSRCKLYGTTIDSCTCQGYSFRHTCRHVEFLKKNFMAGVNCPVKLSVEGIEAVVFVEKYGEDTLKKMKLFGDVFERHGKLYSL